MTADRRAGPTVLCVVEPESRGTHALCEGSRAALREAVAVAGPNGRLHVACVVPPLPRELVFSGGEAIHVLHEQRRIVADTRRWLTTVVHEHLAGTHDVHTHVLEGSPAIEVSRLARTARADLIVVPRHTGNRLTRLISPPPLGRLVRHASCPVMVASQPAGIQAPSFTRTSPSDNPDRALPSRRS